MGVDVIQTLPSAIAYLDSKVQGTNMGPIWGRQGPGGPHDGPMNFAFWVTLCSLNTKCIYLYPGIINKWSILIFHTNV